MRTVKSTFYKPVTDGEHHEVGSIFRTGFFEEPGAVT